MTKLNHWRERNFANIQDAHEANIFPLLYLHSEPKTKPLASCCVQNFSSLCEKKKNRGQCLQEQNKTYAISVENSVC